MKLQRKKRQKLDFVRFQSKDTEAEWSRGDAGEIKKVSRQQRAAVKYCHTLQCVWREGSLREGETRWMDDWRRRARSEGRRGDVR